MNVADVSGPVVGARVRIEANMTHPGMMPFFGEAREIGNGTYQGKVDFSMAGDYFVIARVELPDGRIVERQIDVAGVAPAQGR